MFSYPVSFLQTDAPESAGKLLQWHLEGIGRCASPTVIGLRQIRRIDFFRWTPGLNSTIVFLVRAPPSGGFVEPDVCVQPRPLRCKSANLVVLPLNVSPRLHFHVGRVLLRPRTGDCMRER